MRKNLILGTAGHIDHGKTTLVRALTGVDTDRLPEEKARGITIELGFAPLELAPGLRVGVIDVPGHEGLVRTMVSGATGIDLVLLVVAADEGAMPQTREHLAIIDLLGIEAGAIALTKSDLADPDVADLAEAEVQELIAGTSLAKAQVLRVSAATGAGVPELRAALVQAAESAATRPPRSGPARLWVDRCFESRGFGAIVTGTLVGSALAVGDTVEIETPALRAISSSRVPRAELPSAFAIRPVRLRSLPSNPSSAAVYPARWSMLLSPRPKRAVRPCRIRVRESTRSPDRTG